MPQDFGRNWEAAATWQPWRPDQVTALLKNIDIPWCVVGGWAIDLAVGHETRKHEDIEISIPRPFFETLRPAFPGLKVFTAGAGEVYPLEDGALPPAEKHQNWIMDEAAKAWRLDVFLEPGDVSTWVYRRDPSIFLPRVRIVGRTDQGIPYLRPEGVLLYKAKACRAKDDTDFETALPLMNITARGWLYGVLSRLHPDHPWLDRLDETPFL